MRAPIPPHAASAGGRPEWPGHVLALLCAGVAFAAQWLLSPWLASTPLLLPLAGVLLATRVGGRRPGWLATIVSALLAQLWLSGIPGAPHPVGLPATLLFVAVGGLAATLGGPRRLEVSSRSGTRPGAEAEGTLVAALLRGTDDATLITDAYGLVLHFNAVAARLLGRSEAEVIGKPLAQILHLLRPDTRELVSSSLFRVLGEDTPGTVTESPRLLLQRDGTERLVEERAVPLVGSRGRLLGALLVLRDVSERLHLEQQHAATRAALGEAEVQRERMESLFHQAPVVLAVFHGPDHVCELLNPQAQALIEAQEPVLGRPLREVMPDLNTGLLRLVDDVFHTGVPFSGREVPLLLGSRREGGLPGRGRYFDLSWHPWRAADGSIQGVMAVALEVTAQVNARRAAEALAQEAQEALRTREEFLSIASHELKTPITSLQLQLEMLLRSVPRTGPDPDGTSSEVRRRVEKTLRPVARLQQLVATLLDVSRIRAGRLDLQREPVDLAALVQELAARVQEDAASARCVLKVEVDGPLVGRWDRMRLEQVLTNLLSNAFKYGAQQPVEVRVTRERDCAQVTVTDHGIGIAPEDHERIFQRFERAVSERHYGGFGLGLWIVRQILESLEGDIQVRSQPGQGATFIVRLPLDPAVSAVA